MISCGGIIRVRFKGYILSQYLGTPIVLRLQRYYF
jgi:hypothetical protein